nr:alcohol dehydrogenase catalytic domain-containing protein [Candidatus Sigynarchaeota archaeon]
MEALLLDKYGLKYVVNHPEPAMKDDEILIKVKSVGICGTDMAIVNETLKAPLPIIPGHEIAGIVEKIGPSVPAKMKQLVGKLVTTEINTNTCGTCFFCKAGIPTQCSQRKALGIDVNGGMAGFITVRHDLVHALPDGMSAREGTFIEPLAAAVQTFKMMPLADADDHVIIIGAGKLGLLILQVLVGMDREAGKKSPRKIMVIDHHDFKLELATQFGATVTLNTTRMSEADQVKKVMAFAIGKGADITIEATGNPRALNQAVYMTRARGKVALKSTHGVPVPFDMTVGVVKEITFYTSRCGPFEDAIALVRKGHVELKSLITEVFPLSRGPEAFKDLNYRKGNAIKYILEPKES